MNERIQNKAHQLILKAANILKAYGYDPKIFPELWFVMTLQTLINEYNQYQLNSSEYEALDQLAQCILDKKLNIVDFRKAVFKDMHNIKPSWGGWWNFFNSNRGELASLLWEILKHDHFQLSYMYTTERHHRGQREKQLFTLLTQTQQAIKNLSRTISKPFQFKEDGFEYTTQNKLAVLQQKRESILKRLGKSNNADSPSYRPAETSSP